MTTSPEHVAPIDTDNEVDIAFKTNYQRWLLGRSILERGIPFDLPAIDPAVIEQDDVA